MKISHPLNLMLIEIDFLWKNNDLHAFCSMFWDSLILFHFRVTTSLQLFVEYIRTGELSDTLISVMLISYDCDCLHVHVCMSQSVFTNICGRKISFLSLVDQAYLQTVLWGYIPTFRATGIDAVLHISGLKLASLWSCVNVTSWLICVHIQAVFNLKCEPGCAELCLMFGWGSTSQQLKYVLSLLKHSADNVHITVWMEPFLWSGKLIKNICCDNQLWFCTKSDILFCWMECNSCSSKFFIGLGYFWLVFTFLSEDAKFLTAKYNS